MTKRTGAQALVEVLIAQGVERVFCVPGESFLAVLDALYGARDRVETIVCRHEAAAANMAEATGKLTGRPGVAFVTRGPGATHAAVGVHTAKQDSSPMILFVGQIARGDREREAFQEVDYRALFGPLTKWASEIDDADRVPELVERAFATATQGRMGPVVLALPEDMLTDATEARIGARVAPARAGFDPTSAARIEALLGDARKPFLILGGSGWDEESAGAVSAFATRADLPTALSFRRKHLIDNEAPIYAGDLGLGPNAKLVARLREADLVIAIGARLGENPTQGYTLFTREETARKLVHIHPDPEEIGRVWPPLLGAVADSASAATALSALSVRPNWGAWREAARADYEAYATPLELSNPVNLSELYAHLAQAAPEAIIANDAGNFAIWLHRFYKHRRFNSQVGPTSGAMGYALPAAIGAKLQHPDREVFAVMGDGCFMMEGAELATCMQHGVAVIVLLVDNGSFGTIRMHQERHYPARVHATDLRNPDFVAYAKSFGLWAERIERTADFPAALKAARAVKGPALLHIKVDVETIAPGVTISGLRAKP
ncbi:MAG TPA: thiamine pyrophosphate-dependent enzyme [Caulobacterales bacterium]|nr:thiamine pyrophosphate-dependent enzyme [Caulobacterales bacterium]